MAPALPRWHLRFVVLLAALVARAGSNGGLAGNAVPAAPMRHVGKSGDGCVGGGRDASSARRHRLAAQGCAISGQHRPFLAAPTPADRARWRLRGGSGSDDALDQAAENTHDGESIVGDVLGEDESCEAVAARCSGNQEPNEGPASSASEASVEVLSSAVDEEGNRVWGVRKAALEATCVRGSGREAWAGKYWANELQRRCEIEPLPTSKERAKGIQPKSILWGDDCAEARMDPPPGYFRPYGDAIPLNDTFIGSYMDDSPALLRDVCCGAGDTALVCQMRLSHVCVLCDTKSCC